MNIKNWQKIVLTILFLSFNFYLIVPKAKAQNIEGKITEDELNTRSGLPWSGGTFPWSKVVEIQDSLVNSPVGRIVIDKHTEGVSFINFPLRPGQIVFITFWGSKIEGCYVELIYQIAPWNRMNQKMITPEFLEIGVKDQIVKLIPQEVKPHFYSFNYSYKDGENTYNAIWYMVRQLFVIDQATANVLMNAPNKEVKARIRFPDSTEIFPIGRGTVQRWKDTYNFNPSCNSL
jgi:hypothetical protein